MKVILHMPHTSLKVPSYFYKGLLISKEEFRKYNLKMSDLGIDELFKDLKGKKIKFKYSRMFCDVEKYKDDNKEFMFKYGQGVIYTNTFDNTLFHKHDDKYKKKVYKIYDRYHKKLDKISKRMLRKDDKLLILDLHSFSDEMAAFHHTLPFKDVCIGIEKDYFDQDIFNKIISIIEDNNLTYSINYTYQGSMIPNALFNNEKYKGKVISIMIEVNKRIYL